MKKVSALLLAVMMMVMAFAPAALAAPSDGFQLVGSNPEEGSSNTEATNVMIKLFFSTDVSSETAQKANKDMFKFTDADGKKVDFEIYYNSKDPKNINLLATKDLKTETDYTVTISGDLVDDSGKILGADETLKFSTRKPPSSVTYILLMAAMMGVMMFMTIRDQKKAMQEDEVKNQTISIQTNPYKLAKEKGITVEEAQKLIAAEREKLQKKIEKAEKNAKKNAPAEPVKTKKPEKTVYKVKTKRTVKKH